MTNFMFMIIVVIVLAVIILFGTVFGKQLRVKMKGRTDEVMRQDAQTPEGAKDYYNAAIREKEEFYNRASTSFAEISGKRQAAQNDLRNANKEYMRVTKQMNECIDSNNENEAMQYARMLERVREGARKTRERAEGSRIAYDSSSQAADRRLAASERERNARQILEEAKRQRGK